MKLPLFFSFMFVAATIALAVDDLPLYLDAGCPGTGIPKSYAQGPASMEIATVSGSKAIPITCDDKASGSDAAVLHNTKKLSNGEYFDFIFKFASDRSHSIKNHKDLRMWIKNRNATVAKFRIAWEQANYSTGAYMDMEIPGGAEWKEYVVELTKLSADSVSGLKISHPLGAYNGPDTAADPINILIDSITVTDGTGNGSLAIPAVIRQPRPSAWPSAFLVGSFDNRDLNVSTAAAQAGCPYRYQYMMPETKDYYSASGKGYLYDYATESEKLGVKTAVVWYNLGKSGEGYGPVSTNLQSATYMTGYVDRYEWVLDQLALAGQSDYIIIIEPDMYGFIMRGEKYHPAEIPVNMAHANEVSGKTYASNMVGWAEYLVERAHAKLPKGVMLGHMPNHWGVNIPGQVGQGRKEAHLISGLTIGQFIKEFGDVGKGDMVFVEKTDHDAGHKPSGENWFWDSTGYAKYFLWTGAIAHRTGLPIVGWQVSEGNMTHATTTMRDNAAETFLANPLRWIDGGFIGILFGAGNSDCCNYKADNDGGWFVTNIKAYNDKPYPFPATAIVPSHRKPLGNDAAAAMTVALRNHALRIDGFTGTVHVVMADVAGRTLYDALLTAGEVHPLPQLLSPGIRLITVSAGGKRLQTVYRLIY
jgi:hypothetical protein